MTKSKTSRVPASAATTRLEKHVRAWINKQATVYTTGAEDVFEDLLYGGCSSGIVSHLIYTSDAAKFYRKHRADIAALVADYIESTGEPFKAGKQWDDSDPFANTDQNQNLLAWFGFEEAARMIQARMEQE